MFVTQSPSHMWSRVGDGTGGFGQSTSGFGQGTSGFGQGAAAFGEGTSVIGKFGKMAKLGPSHEKIWVIAKNVMMRVSYFERQSNSIGSVLRFCAASFAP